MLYWAMLDTRIDFDLNELLLQIAIATARLQECAEHHEDLVHERAALMAQARARGLLLAEDGTDEMH